MENCLKRKPAIVSSGEGGHIDENEYSKYKQQTRGEYEDLMMEFEFRCRRAAMMNYHEASRHDNNAYRLEILVAFLGTVSVSSIFAWFLPGNSWLTSPSTGNLSRLGTLGIVGVTGAGLLHLLSKGSSRIIPSLSKRAETYVGAAAAWQRLAQKTRSYRIRLDNPKLDVPDYADWYEGLIAERERLCVMAVIPQTTYDKFNNPRLVYHTMRQRRQMFLQYLQLETSDLDDFQTETRYHAKVEP
ncbi:hypothetical protein PoB_001102400 [Plakobranchus ocellatus]|uniref:Uncharacterized protein n=1 Tax=Plakobranchus ocellatus TaxID=259542 RepID=A0AAV3YRA5_9GAST|nr:hypothetical protein PoB_001102400 [Plakobranchus ocellatus]